MDHIHSRLEIQFAQFSDKGAKPENQDTIGARIPEGPVLTTKGIAIAIADGVSSSGSAKIASQTAVTGFLNDYYATPDTWRTRHSAVQVIQSLNRFLWGQSQNSVRQEGHLTTLSCLILKGDSAFIFHVGDTRIYRFREGTLEQLTRDHSQKIDKDTQYLSRALGADLSVDIDTLNEGLRVGDMFLLSSDGIHEALSDHQLTTYLSSGNDCEKSAELILNAAMSNGAKDNLSLQLARISSIGCASKKDTVKRLSQLPFPPVLNVGHKIDGYLVKKIIQESERSQVYLVENDSSQSFVMKTPSPSYQDDPAYIERFVMESWIGSRIQNAQVVRVIDPKIERKFLYYLTEYLPGPTLARVIKERSPLSVIDAVELTENIVKGLRGFHRKDTLHQDIKPANIIVGAQGPVIIDFGSCFVAGVQEAALPLGVDHVLGTLSYSAPEYRCGGNIGQRADQFSLAVILYEMLTSKHPYGESYETAMSLKSFERLRYIPARKYNPLVPVWLDRALEKALDILPAKRYASLSEWLVDLKRPNPNWLRHDELPLMERDPLGFWRALALIGWCAALALFVDKFL